MYITFTYYFLAREYLKASQMVVWSYSYIALRTAILLWAQRASTGIDSHQIICTYLYEIFNSIKKLHVIILTKERKKTQQNMHHEVERQVTAKVQLLKHILLMAFLTLQAQPIQNHSAALLS